MNPHFTLFREAMARPGTAPHAGSGGGVAVAGLIIGVVLAAAILIPIIAG